MQGIFSRAMIGVVASASPELVGPQMALTLARLISSWVALTALVGSPWVSRVTISTRRPPAPLISSAANSTPRLKPIAGAELAPVSAASQPMRIGSAPWAAAVRARAAVAAAPSIRVRRVVCMIVPLVVLGNYGAPAPLPPGAVRRAGDH